MTKDRVRPGIVSVRIPTPNGGSLVCYEGEVYNLGSQVSLQDIQGNEIVMWTWEEWRDDPECVMSAIFGMAIMPIPELLQRLGRTRVEDNCWV